MEDTKAQWHPAFCSAMELGFQKNRESLEFLREQNISKKPLALDLLIIKKNDNFEPENKIGKIFKQFNIIEYKSPDASMNIDTFYKTIAYGCLYKTMNGISNQIPANEITLTLIKERHPRKLMQTLKNEGYLIGNPEPGIYYISGRIPFQTQIVVTRELN